MKNEVKPVDAEDLKKEVEKDMLAKAQKQQDAAAQINKILVDNDLHLVIEQNIKIVPNQ